jgi:RNA polymerase sigma-70 factor (sigma-E family)
VLGDNEVSAKALSGGSGEPANSFEQLALSARPALLRVAQGVTGQREDAEDAVQASLLKAMAAWAKVESQEGWRQQAYIRQIVVNTCRSGWRKWGSRVALCEPPERAHREREVTVDDRLLLSQALSRLPMRQREVLLLRYWYDLSEAEIAARLGCAPGTVKSSAARALRSLRDMLAECAPPVAAAQFGRGSCGDEPPGRQVFGDEPLGGGKTAA